MLLGASAVAQASVGSNTTASDNPPLTTIPAEKSLKPLTVASIGPHPGGLVPSFGPLNFNITALLSSGVIAFIASRVFGSHR
ncbi:hypothetical protein D3C81_1588810 [compost metagenome]